MEEIRLNTPTTFTIESVDPNVVLANASWCVKSTTTTNNGTGTSGASTSTNKKGVVQAISYVVIYSVTSEEPAEPCDATTSSGGQGVAQTTVHSLGVARPASFLFEWETLHPQPDQLEVFYEGVEDLRHRPGRRQHQRGDRIGHGQCPRRNGDDRHRGGDRPGGGHGLVVHR